MAEITSKFGYTTAEIKSLKQSRSLASSEASSKPNVNDSDTKIPRDHLKYVLGLKNGLTPSQATNGTNSSPAKVLDHKAKNGPSLF
jgi:hypothetical protein